MSTYTFGTVVLNEITARQNAVQRANATLQLNQVNQTITVQSAAEELQTDKADISHAKSNTQLTNLPTTSSTGRNFQSLYRLVPGATPPAEQNSAGANPPAFLFTGFSGLGNTTTGSPFLFRDNQYIGNINLSWSHGTHSMRFGGGTRIAQSIISNQTAV